MPEVALPDFSPPSPALSARSDTSGRLSVLGKIAGIGRHSSRATIGHAHSPSSASISGASQVDASSRPSSPLIAPSLTSDDLSEVEDGEGEADEQRSLSSMPGSFEDDRGKHLNDPFFAPHSQGQQSRSSRSLGDQKGGRGKEEGEGGEGREDGEGEREGGDSYSYDDDAIFDDDILAAGEMQHVPF